MIYTASGSLICDANQTFSFAVPVDANHSEPRAANHLVGSVSTRRRQSIVMYPCRPGHMPLSALAYH
jgi:hypothetical protein